LRICRGAASTECDTHQRIAWRPVVVDVNTSAEAQHTPCLLQRQARLVQLSYQGLVTDEVLAPEQQRLEVESPSPAPTSCSRTSGHRHSDTLDGVLEKTSSPQATYIASTPLERRLLNHALFEAHPGERARPGPGTTLTPIYAALAAWQPDLGTPHTPHDPPEPSTQRPRPRFQGQGSYVKPQWKRRDEDVTVELGSKLCGRPLLSYARVRVPRSADAGTTSEPGHAPRAPHGAGSSRSPTAGAGGCQAASRDTDGPSPSAGTIVTLIPSWWA
jgi:hypothetical protein